MILALKKGQTNSGSFKKGHIPYLKGTRGLSKPNSGSFKKGHPTWNKGKKGVMPKPWNKGTKGIMKPNSTSFKKGQIPHNKGKQGLSKPNSGSFKKGQKPWNTGRTGVYTEERIQHQKEKRLHQVFPKKDSKIEKIIQEGLKKRKIPFTTHIPLIGQPDVLIEPNVCVFVDSDWFHGYTYMSGHDCSKYKMFNNEYFEKKIQRDKEITQLLTEQGYNVLRFWGHEIEKDPEKCLQKIIKIIKESSRK